MTIELDRLDVEAFLYSLGYYSHPEHPTGVSDFGELLAMSEQERSEKKAIALFAYQTQFGLLLDDVAMAVHHRPSDPDGEYGPATEILLHMPRCACPDFPVAGTHSEEGRRLEATGAMQANWPTSCRGNLRFGRSFSALPGVTSDQVTMAMWASANNATYALSDVAIVVSNSNPHRLAGASRIAGNTLAWSYLANNTCNQLRQMYNTGVTWSLEYLATVVTHEDGHALGGPHVTNDPQATMYPYINAAARSRIGWWNQSDLNMLRSLGYTLSGSSAPPRDKLYLPRPHTPEPPEPEPPTPEPPEPPPESKLRFRYTPQGIVAEMGGKQVGEFVLSETFRV